MQIKLIVPNRRPIFIALKKNYQQNKSAVKQMQNIHHFINIEFYLKRKIALMFFLVCTRRIIFPHHNYYQSDCFHRFDERAKIILNNKCKKIGK